MLGFTPLHADGVTSLLLGLLGDRPAVRHEACAGSAIRALLARAGIDWSEDTRVFRTADEAERRADELIAEGFLLFGPYPLRMGRFPDEAHLVPPRTLRELNSKERLADIVPADNLPARRILSLPEFRRLRFERPVFLKAGGDLATGWGYAVRWCGDEGSLSAARDWFLSRPGEVPSVIVEEAVDVVSSWCAGLAVTAGRAICFGGAEQVFTEPGRQSGSILDPGNAPPPEALRVAELVGEAARRRGFLGIAGLDIGLARDGRFLVFDPNFRINSSTPQLLFHPAAAQRSGLPASRSVNTTIEMPFPALAERLAAVIDAGWFVPTRLFDGTSHPAAAGRHMVTGFVLGEDRPRAEAAVARLMTALVP